MEKIKTINSYLLGILLFLMLIYGIFWITKEVSYWLLYEDMVIATVTKIVTEGCNK